MADVPALARTVEGSLATEVPVVLLPAFPLDRRMWAGPAAALAAGRVPSVRVDLPGLGESPLPAGTPDLAVAADAVAAVLDDLAVPRAIVAGVSMGGYVALAFARRHAARLAGLALVDTKAAADDGPARANRERIAAAVLGDAGTRALAPMLDGLLGEWTRAHRRGVLETVRGMLAGARPEGVAWSQRAMAARPDATAELAGIGVPAAVVVGEQDGLTPPSAARALAGALPDAVLTVVPRAGHLTPLEDPDAVVAALRGLVLRVR